MWPGPPGPRQAQSNEAGRVPSLSSQPHGGDDCGSRLGRRGGTHRPSQAGHFQLAAKRTHQHLLRRLLLSATSLPLVEKVVSFLSKEEQDEGSGGTPQSSHLGELGTPVSDYDVLSFVLVVFLHMLFHLVGKHFPFPAVISLPASTARVLGSRRSCSSW